MPIAKPFLVFRKKALFLEGKCCLVVDFLWIRLVCFVHHSELLFEQHIVRDLSDLCNTRVFVMCNNTEICEKWTVLKCVCSVVL